MKAALLHSFVLPFYRNHAGILLAACVVLFGIIKAGEHVALAAGFISSPVMTLIPSGVWVVFTGLVINSNRKSIALPENRYLRNFLTLNRTQRSAHLFQPVLQQMSLPLLYATFLIVVAVQHEVWIAALQVLLTISALLLLPTIDLTRRLEGSQSGTQSARSRAISFDWFFSRHILSRYPVQLLILTAAAGIVTRMIHHLYELEPYDGRFYTMAWNLVFAGYLLWMFDYHLFVNSDLRIMRTWPIPGAQHVFFMLRSFMPVVVPAWILMIINFPPLLSYYDLLGIVALSVSSLLLAQGFLYRRDFPRETFTLYVFYYSLLVFVVILFKMPPLLFSALQALLGIWWLIKNYSTFEFDSSLKSGR